jgi:uncharacterized protein HemX
VETTEPPWVHNEAGERANAYMVVGDTKLAPLLVALAAVGLVLAGLALGVALWARDQADRAEMRADQLQLEVESFKNVLHAAKLPAAAHLPGESP